MKGMATVMVPSLSFITEAQTAYLFASGFALMTNSKV